MNKTILTTALLAFASGLASAQIEEIVKKKREVGLGTAKHFRYVAPESDTITIKIYNPRGQLVSTPVLRKNITAGSNVEFSFNPRIWKDGQYHIVAEGRRIRNVSKKIMVDNEN